ncbi:Hypothetical predicted protein, partial [Scomber scombrus]
RPIDQTELKFDSKHSAGSAGGRRLSRALNVTPPTIRAAEEEKEEEEEEERLPTDRQLCLIWI